MQEGFAFSHCTTCKAQFHLLVESFEDNTWRKLKFRLFVARDVLLVFLAVQTVSRTLTFFFRYMKIIVMWLVIIIESDCCWVRGWLFDLVFIFIFWA